MSSKLRVLVVRPGEPPAAAEIDGSLEAMQGLVGGTIQAIYPFGEPVALVCNDEGKLLGLPLNRALCVDGAPYDAVAGTFFLCGAPPDSDAFTSLTEEQMKRYAELYRDPECFIRVGNAIVQLLTE